MMMTVNIVRLMILPKVKQTIQLFLFEKYLKETGVATDELFNEMNKRVMDIVNEATDYAEEAPYSPPEHALKHVYAEGADE